MKLSLDIEMKHMHSLFHSDIRGVHHSFIPFGITFFISSNSVVILFKSQKKTLNISYIYVRRDVREQGKTDVQIENLKTLTDQQLGPYFYFICIILLRFVSFFVSQSFS